MRPDEPCVHERDADPDGPLFRFFFHTGLPCAQCQAEERAAWVESVRARLAAGLEAAAAGERFDWGAPDSAGDEPRFALVRLDDRIDLALTVDEHGRCTVPVAGWFTFPRVMTLQEAVDAERWARIEDQLGRGVMTLNQARRTYSPIGFDTSPLFPDGAGEILHAFVNAEPEPGPPYTHVFRPPETEYDEDGEPIWKPLEPTFTLTSADVADMIDRDERAFMFGLCPQGHLRRARTRTGTFGEVVTAAYCPVCEGGGDD